MEYQILRPDQFAANVPPNGAATPSDIGQAIIELYNAIRRFSIAAARVVNQNAGFSGVTTARPTLNLQVGNTMFDTTLGKPIWVKQVTPSIVWVDATGAVV